MFCFFQGDYLMSDLHQPSFPFAGFCNICQMCDWPPLLSHILTNASASSRERSNTSVKAAGIASCTSERPLVKTLCLRRIKGAVSQFSKSHTVLLGLLIDTQAAFLFFSSGERFLPSPAKIPPFAAHFLPTLRSAESHTL